MFCFSLRRHLMAGRRKISRIKWMLDFRKKMFFKHFITISKKKDIPQTCPWIILRRLGSFPLHSLQYDETKKQERLLQWTVAWSWSGSLIASTTFFPRGLSQKRNQFWLCKQARLIFLPQLISTFFLQLFPEGGRSKSRMSQSAPRGTFQGAMKHNTGAPYLYGNSHPLSAVAPYWYDNSHPLFAEVTCTSREGSCIK